jgi:hypothetical protein
MTALISPLQILLFGTVALWLLAALPAAAVTALKEQWLLFITGFFTLGMVWFVGAASLAEPGSWWAARFYDERKLARAVDRERHPGSPRTTAAVIGSIVLTIAVLGLFAAYPSPIVGVDGKALEHSVGGASVGGSLEPCRKETQGTWSCSRWDRGGSNTVDYRVTVDGLGCWTARRVGQSAEGSDKRLSGCITIRDHIRPFERLF